MKISAVMGVFNAAPYLSDAIASIVGQDYSDWELVVVDDGSTDDTAVIAETWQERDERIVVHRLPHSGVPGRPRNFGLGRVTGDIVTVLDGDDVTHRRRFSTVVDAFRQFPCVAGVYHDYVRFESPQPSFSETPVQRATRYVERAIEFGAFERVSEAFYRSTDLLFPFLAASGTGMLQGNLAVRRPDMEALGPRFFADDLITFEDVDFYLRMAAGRTLLFMDVPLFAYRRTPGSLLESADEPQNVDAIFRVKGPALHGAVKSLGRKTPAVVNETIAEGWRSLGWRAARARKTAIAMRCYLECLRTTRQPRRKCDAAVEWGRSAWDHATDWFRKRLSARLLR